MLCGHCVSRRRRRHIERVRGVRSWDVLGHVGECVLELCCGDLRRVARLRVLFELRRRRLRRDDGNASVRELRRWHIRWIDRGGVVVKLRELRRRILRFGRRSERVLELRRRVVQCGRGHRLLSELRSGHIPRLVGPDCVHELPFRKLLRVFGAVGSFRCVQCRRVRRLRGQRMLKLRRGDVPGQHRSK